ncbi:reverse transcriptase [Senna tora]|uniref:Reverse transcriptase n=1 Tax=Senna tora TaxID=362788 RepID=A0A835CA47_9FABA|nr:reverse transcriptase [Senna tora]
MPNSDWVTVRSKKKKFPFKETSNSGSSPFGGNMQVLGKHKGFLNSNASLHGPIPKGPIYTNQKAQVLSQIFDHPSKSSKNQKREGGSQEGINHSEWYASCLNIPLVVPAFNSCQGTMYPTSSLSEPQIEPIPLPIHFVQQPFGETDLSIESLDKPCRCNEDARAMDSILAKGPWLMWNEDKISLKVIEDTFQEMHAKVEISPQLAILEQNLSKQYRDTLLMEEEFWASMARLDWLHLGDDNTRFFLSSVISRRRQSKILGLANSLGKWVDDTWEIRSLFVDYLTECFSTSKVKKIPSEICSSNDHLAFSSFGCHVPNFFEVKEALWDLKPFKEVGVDGFQPCFFRKYWDTCIDFEVATKGKWKALLVEGIKISHLLYADDVLSVNEAKSSVWFTPNTMVQKEDFNEIVKKIRDKVESWKAPMLSKASRVTLIKSISAAMANYYMQALPFSMSVCT